MTRNAASYVATASAVLAGRGAHLSVIHGGKHPKLIIELNGQVLKHTFPGSPSDYRSRLNWKSQLRRRLSLIGLVDAA